MIPRFTPCSSSPPAGASSRTKRSVISATTVSDCPTPTVSTSTTSNPAASQSATRLARAPRNAPELRLRRRRTDEGLRIAREPLHPRLVAQDRTARARAEEGSTASTATRSPCPVSIIPKLSMKVDLPTPGVPESPIRTASRPGAPKPLHQLGGHRAMVRPPALHQCHGARQRPTVARDHLLGQLRDIHATPGLLQGPECLPPAPQVQSRMDAAPALPHKPPHDDAPPAHRRCPPPP
jgi:hypothetical protein